MLIFPKPKYDPQAIFQAWFGLGHARGRRGISPTIATVILVAVAISIAITAGLWYSGIIQGYLTVEKVDLVLGAAERIEPPDSYRVTVYITNTGTRDIKINGVYLNGKTFWEANVSRVSFYIQNVSQTMPLTFLLPIGQKATIEVYLGQLYKAGQNIEIKLMTAAGNQIVQTKNLP